MKENSRRQFIKAGGIGVAAMVASTGISSAKSINNLNKVPAKHTILMQGDSITDAGRSKANYYANQSQGMGRGYVFQIVSSLMGQFPNKEWKFYNRGISGNKVFQLRDRWEDDCMQLQPDVLSILIGVNDFWHSLRDYNGTVTTYENDFRALLKNTTSIFPDLKLIIGEPFAVKGGSAINEQWFPEFPEYQKVAKQIAGEFKASFIPYQKIFDDALKVAPVSYWCPDGVHPSMAGAYLMKEAWIDVFTKLY